MPSSSGNRSGPVIVVTGTSGAGKGTLERILLDAFPELVSAKGPHGIPLRVHAEKGGEPAQAVLALLDERS